MISVKKYIPNTITSLNLLCGVLGILSCLSGSVETAFLFMLAAAVFDFCDGFAARMLGAYSDMGKELDSISDVVSFGVLPSVMLCCFASDSYAAAIDPLFNGSMFVKYAVCGCPVLIAVFSGLRLAKFNVDERQSDRFLGLATPASAILFGSFVCCLYHYLGTGRLEQLWNWNAVRIYLPVAVIAACILIVCELPMFSFKIKKGHSLFSGYEGRLRVAFAVLAACALAAVVVLELHFSAFFTLAMLLYVVVNLFGWLWTVTVGSSSDEQ